MTALKQYERLESTGIWREHAEAQRRDVYVSFGDASLVIRDRAEAPLAHWSLSAIERLNPGRRPAVYAPGRGADESLEIEDATMIQAIERVVRALRRARPRRGRLRLAIAALLIAGFAALAWFWLPGTLVRYAEAVLPPAKRAQIDSRLIAAMGEFAGAPCRIAGSDAALARVAARLSLPGAPIERIVVLRDGRSEAVYLPGGTMVMSRRLVEDHENPEVPGGYALAALAAAMDTPPLAKLLLDAGTLATLRLLTTGQLPAEAIRAHAQALLAATPDRPDDAALLPLFATAQLSSTPYAYALDVSGETTLGLIEADPFGHRPYPALLPDSDWVLLQSICGA